jgi:Ser-tRNA(Ala) deacylase AlaX
MDINGPGVSSLNPDGAPQQRVVTVVWHAGADHTYHPTEPRRMQLHTERREEHGRGRTGDHIGVYGEEAPDHGVA